MTDREKLIELLEQSYFNSIETLADCLIAHGVTVQRWIPVTERLPEIYEKDPNWSATVLFRTAQGHIHSGYRNIGKPQTSFYDDDWTPPYWLDESENLSFEEGEVTHWMPLPEPPKEGE